MADSAEKSSVLDQKELLKAGSQFGHETKRWNPKMRKFIFGEKGGIHIIDINQTLERLAVATSFLEEVSAKGNILFVGTKRQASQIVREEAIGAGAYFIDVRWAGGLLTNFKMIKESLTKLNELERMFEEGVHDRTKFEVSRMKKEWFKLNRLYSGIKSLSSKPVAVVVLDTNFEKAAIKECRKIGIPLVGVVDSNSDPDSVDYPVPGNDDAVSSIKLFMKAFADAVLIGNKGEGVKHNLKDYAKVEVKITKKGEIEESIKAEELLTAEESGVEGEDRVRGNSPEVVKIVSKKTSSAGSKGILERVKDEADKKRSEKGLSTKKKVKKESIKSSKK